MISAKAHGAAAALQNDIDLAKSQALSALLSPEHLRYLAKQLKLVKIIKEHMEEFKEVYVQQEDEEFNIKILEKVLKNPDNADKGIDEDKFMEGYARFVDKLLGDKFVNSLKQFEKQFLNPDETVKLDVSELSYPDPEIFTVHKHFSLDLLTEEIARLEKEADLVE